jgi:hypothetical protein
MTSHSFGTGWRFGPPHTVVPLSWRDWDPAAWERVWMYRKRFDAPSGPATRTWATRSRVSGSAEVLTRREGARHARADDDLDNDG